MDDLMPFGKYKGRPLGKIPKGYWRWLHKNVDLRGRLLEVCASVLAGRGVRPTPPPLDVEAEVERICKPWESP
jgi:hypothetical protein